MRRLLWTLIITLLLNVPALAQSGGQFCVRAFEDRNANGALDGGEPLLTSGVSADLLNAENVIVASALLSQSPTAAQGVICFQFLAPGQYSMIITSPEYAATTPNTVTAAITEGTLPTVVTFGGQQLVVEAAEQPDTTSTGLSSLIQLDRDTLPRIVISVLGTLLVIAGMIILGSLIYLLAFRQSRAPERAYYPPAPTSGKIPAVHDTDEIRRA